MDRMNLRLGLSSSSNHGNIQPSIEHCTKQIQRHGTAALLSGLTTRRVRAVADARAIRCQTPTCSGDQGLRC